MPKKPKYPQEEALKLAQLNAIRMLGLHKHNTAEERAQAMGYTGEGFHGTAEDIREVDPNRAGATDYGTIGQGFYLDPSKDAAYANLVNRLLDAKHPGQPRRIMPVRYKPEGLFDATDLGAIRDLESSKRATKALQEAGHSGTFSRQHGSDKLNEIAMFNPSHIRSRFAAFDPARAHEAGLNYSEGGNVNPTVEQMRQAVAHYAKGGAEKEAALPLNLPRAPSMLTQDMQAHVDRIARQQTGEHVTSGKPKDTANLAGRSMAEAKRVKNLEYGLSHTRQLPESPEFHGRAGDINVAVPGDQTISDTVLEHINGIPVGSTSEGGARYGLGKLHKPAAEQDFWASGEDPAQNFQNKVDALARMTGESPRIIAHHLAMGRISNNFAMHLADSNLKYMAAHFPEEAGLHAFNRQIEGGYMAQHPKTKAKFRVTFPDFPGVHRPDEAYMAMQKNPLMRKWFNNRAKSSKLTKELGLPSGLDTEYAITEPALRNMEINLTGHGVGEMQPGEKLREGAEHGTYSHGIKGRYVGHAPELAPLDIAFPDASAYIRSKYNPSDFTGTMQKVFPHQVVDPQHLDQMAKYYDMLRKTRGFAEGGEVEPSQDEMLAHVMLHKAVGGAVTPDAPDQPNGESTDLGYYEGGPSDGANVDPMQYLADGGAVKPSDIGVDEAPDMPVKLYLPPGDGTGNKMPIGGVDFQPQTPGQQMAPAQAQPQQGGQLGAAPTGAPQGAGMPQMGQAPQMPPTGGAGAPTGPQSNILNMTRQGQAMSAMRATPPPSPLIKPGMPHMKKGGKVALTTEQMKAALKRKKAAGGEFEPSKISDIGMTERPL